MREQQELQRSIQVGDEVITTSGVYGTITGEDGEARFWLEIDDDVQIRIARAAIQGKASRPTPSQQPTTTSTNSSRRTPPTTTEHPDDVAVCGPR